MQYYAGETCNHSDLSLLMKEDDHYPDLLNEFSPVDTQEWLEKARKDLKGEEPLQKFAWEPNPGIHIKPYYDRKDLENLPGLFPDHPVVHSEAPDPRFWENREAVKVSAVNEANALALEALNGGANGLIFYCDGTKEVNLDTLLNHVPLPQTFVSFSALENGQALWNDIEQLLRAQGLENTVQGSFYTDNRNVELLERRVKIASEGFKSIGIQCGTKNCQDRKNLPTS